MKPKNSERLLRIQAELKLVGMQEKLEKMGKELRAKDDQIKSRDLDVERLKDEVFLLEHELKRARESARLLTSLVEKNRR